MNLHLTAKTTAKRFVGTSSELVGHDDKAHNRPEARRAIEFMSLMAALLLSLPAGAAPAVGIFGNPMDLSAHVHEALLPGGTVFDDAHTVTGAGTNPKQTAEYLFVAPDMGQNFSGRSTNIPNAFASALAESDGNGGGGGSAWSGGPPAHATGDQVGQLVAQASWAQSFGYGGSAPQPISMHLVFPQIQVGLIGVPANRSAVNAAETAQVSATLDTVITRANGSLSGGGSFSMQVEMFERQLGTPGNFSNFADVTFDGLPAGTHVDFGGSDALPVFTVDPFSTNVAIGTLQPGDLVTYSYTLTARGTTKGFERGFFAFLGDPFGLESVVGNLGLEVTAVPEPETGSLMALGMAIVAFVARNRRRR